MVRKTSYSGVILIAAALWMTGCGNHAADYNIAVTDVQAVQETADKEEVSLDDDLTFPIGQAIFHRQIM